MSVKTDLIEVQDYEEYHDIDCEAWFDDNQVCVWRQRIAYDKLDSKVSIYTPVQVSENQITPFHDADSVPSEIAQAMAVRCAEAKAKLEEEMRHAQKSNSNA